jgi:hypothetical protein
MRAVSCSFYLMISPALAGGQAAPFPAPAASGAAHLSVADTERCRRGKRRCLSAGKRRRDHQVKRTAHGTHSVPRAGSKQSQHRASMASPQVISSRESHPRPVDPAQRAAARLTSV